MASRDYRDMIAGAALIAIGLFATLYALHNYPIGRYDDMGPGMLPAVLGCLLVGLGLILSIPAMFRPGTLPSPDLRSFAFVLIGVLAFALSVDRLGMAPAIVLLIAAAALADAKLGVRTTAALVIGLLILATLIFRVALRIQIPTFKWPF